jgi:hypothetical protein
MIAALHGCDGCPPCVYAHFERHRDRCATCLSAPTARDYCPTGLTLLDAALGDAGLPEDGPPAPVARPRTNAMTRDLGSITLAALADELRLYTVRYRHSPTSVDEVRPWGGEVGEVARRETARRFVYMNRCVLAGVVSDWKGEP